VTDQFELFVTQKMLDVCACAAEETIDADYTRPFAQQSIAKMRAKEPGSARN
jgi:hypothetical protein